MNVPWYMYVQDPTQIILTMVLDFVFSPG
jgi:hypothetical protein